MWRSDRSGSVAKCRYGRGHGNGEEGRGKIREKEKGDTHRVGGGGGMNSFISIF